MVCLSLNYFLPYIIFSSYTLETSNMNYIKSISELESTISKHMQNENDLRQKLEYAKSETTHALNELAQYRSRAQATLQMKEKMIEQLKNGDQEPTPTNEGDDLIVNQLKIEKDELMTEVQNLNERYEKSRKFIDSMEEKHQEMDETINRLNQKCSHLEAEIRGQKAEMVQEIDELNNEIIKFSTQLREK